MLPNLKLAVRSLLRSPGFTIVAVLMLALGVGASTACFSFLNAFFLRPPPFERPAELVSLNIVEGRSPELMRLSWPNFSDYRAQNSVFTDLAFHMYLGVRFTEGTNNSNVFGQLVTGNYFELLGVQPALGRFLGAADDREGAPPVVVVSHAFWQNKLAGDPAAVGRTVLFNDTPFTVIGVAPAGFRGVSLIDEPDYWVPASTARIVLPGPGLDNFNSRRAVMGFAFGRLQPGVTLDQAVAAMQPLSDGLAKDYPADNGGRALRLMPVAQTMMNPNMRSDLLRAGNLLLGLSGLILLIACANVANLLLARASARQRELALRVALGAGRRQVVGQLLREHFLLAALGGALGVVIAFWLRDLLWALRPPGYPVSVQVSLDASVLVFALCATLLTGLLFGIVPALMAARIDLVAVLKRGTGGGNGLPLFSFRHLLVAGQVALSVVALVVAGLFVRSLGRTNAVTLGWDSHNLVLLSTNLANRNYGPARALEYYQRTLEKLRSVPGVSGVSLSSRAFLTGVNPQRTIRPQGDDEPLRTRGRFMSYACVEPDFLSLMGIALVSGRGFTAHDNSSQPAVVIVNEAFARLAWPGQDPLGRTMKLYNSEDLVQVVGVVGDIRDTELRATPAPFAYFPMRQAFTHNNVFHIRTAGSAADLLPTLRQEMQAIDPGVDVYGGDFAEILHRAMWGPRTGATLMSVFGAVALLLASLGIYAVMSQAITARTREIGIRLALGAQARAVLALVLTRGILVAGAGVLAGLVASLGLTRYIRSFLFEVSPTDPVAFAAVAAGLGLVALAACLIPARRATRVDPMIALRSE